MSREIRSLLMDIDGALVYEEHAIPGADRFLARLRARGTPFLVVDSIADLVAELEGAP